jgi:hypothetical protein
LEARAVIVLLKVHVARLTLLDCRQGTTYCFVKQEHEKSIIVCTWHRQQEYASAQTDSRRPNKVFSAIIEESKADEWNKRIKALIELVKIS